MNKEMNPRYGNLFYIAHVM